MRDERDDDIMIITTKSFLFLKWVLLRIKIFPIGKAKEIHPSKRRKNCKRQKIMTVVSGIH